MKFNLKTREEGKINIGCAIYMSDKIALDGIANSMGVPVSLLLRSVINDIIDEKITFNK